MAPPLPPKPYIISSSPGRSEKLPTPGLARLLRGKSSSRSRNRTRSSPLFSSKTRTANRTDTGDNGEPSSPKVTCIGQVRIRNNSKSNTIRSDSRKPNPDKKTVMCCCFIKRIVFRRSAAVKSIWKRLRVTGHAGGYRERIEPADPDLDPDPVPAPFNVDGEGDESEIRVSVPPKNALVLMRCRSAPHNRSSSLAGRFIQIYVTGDGREAVNGEEGEGKEAGGVCDNGGEEEEEEEDRRCRSSRPLFLKRCKSEPAAKAAILAAPAADCGGGGGECGWPAGVLRQV